MLQIQHQHYINKVKLFNMWVYFITKCICVTIQNNSSTTIEMAATDMQEGVLEGSLVHHNSPKQFQYWFLQFSEPPLQGFPY